MNTTNKYEILLSFGETVKNFRNSFIPKISQTIVCEMINEHLPIQMQLRQETLSKIERAGSYRLFKEQIQAIFEICKIDDLNLKQSLITLFACNINKESFDTVNIKNKGYILTSPQSEDIKPYLGEYYCYYHSTDSSDPKIVQGRILLKKDDRRINKCIAVLTINNQNEDVIKEYTGQFFINTRYNTSYCILVGEKNQEVSFLLSNHFNPSINDNLINIALSLTTAAGNQKRPTMHRMIISRKKPSREAIELLKGQLRLNTDVISISEKRLKELADGLNDDFVNNTKYHDEIQQCIKYLINRGKREVYYHIDESVLYDSSEVIEDESIRGYIVSYIRKHADNPYCNKISDTVRDICLEIIENYNLIVD